MRVKFKKNYKKYLGALSFILMYLCFASNVYSQEYSHWLQYKCDSKARRIVVREIALSEEFVTSLSPEEIKKFNIINPSVMVKRRYDEEKDSSILERSSTINKVCTFSDKRVAVDILPKIFNPVVNGRCGADISSYVFFIISGGEESSRVFGSIPFRNDCFDKGVHSIIFEDKKNKTSLQLIKNSESGVLHITSKRKLKI